MTEEQPGKKRRRVRRWVWIVLALVLLPVVAALVLWFGVPPEVPDEPVHLVRGEDGEFVHVGESAGRSKLSFEVHAGTIEANNAFNSSSSVVSTDRSCFPCRKIVILNLSDHLLPARAGARLVEHLKQLKGPDQIDYYPHGCLPEEGESAPDVVITLDLGSISESGLRNRKLDTQILVSAGRAVVASQHSYYDSFSPPVVRFDWQGQLHHRSTTTGTGSRSSRYKLQADNIAKQIADGLSKQIDQWRKKYGELAELPEAFYPPYRKPPEMPFLGEFGAERVTACHGLMVHNETFWRFTTDREALDVLNGIKTQMESAGWGQAMITGKDDESPHLRMFREAAVLSVFVHTPRQDVPHLVVTHTGAAKAEKQKKTFYVHYLDRMTRDESKAAVERMFDDNVPVDTLVLFPLDWSETQCERISATAARHPSLKPRTWLALAKLHHHFNQERPARDALARAHALNHTAAGDADLSADIRRLAKELGDDKLHEKTLDEALCRELGFIELKAGGVPELEVALDEPAIFFGRTDRNQLKTITVRVVRAARVDGKATWALAHVDACGSERSWGSGGTIQEGRPAAHHTRLNGVCTVVIKVANVPGKERFRVSVEVVPHRKDAGND